MQQPLQITAFDDLEALGPRAAEWNALAARNATATVFQTFEWHACWWRAFGKPGAALVLVAEAAGRLAGIAPLMLREERIFGRRRRVLEFVGTHAADYSDFIVDRPQTMGALLGWLAAHRGHWDLIHLINIADTSPLRERLPQAFPGCVADVRMLYECPAWAFGDREADERLLRKRDIRQHGNRLRKQGEVRFEVLRDAAAVERHLDAFFRQHIDRWAETPTPSFFHDARQRLFYHEQVRRLAPLGRIVFSILSLDATPISFHFGYQDGGRLLYIKPTFAPAYRDFAPGMLQIRHVLEYAARSGLAEVDFTTGEESYKYRFSNRVRQVYGARIFPATLFFGVDRVLGRVKGAARRSPALLRAGRRLRRLPWIGETLHRLGL